MNASHMESVHKVALTLKAVINAFALQNSNLRLIIERVHWTVQKMRYLCMLPAHQ